MKLAKDLYLVGSGGVGISNVTDGNVYLIDGHRELGLVDTGSGVATDRILENIRQEGFDVKRIRVILLTHAHYDHSRGIPFIRKETDCRVGIHPKGVEELGKETAPDHPVSKAGFVGKPVRADFTFTDGQIVEVGDYKLKVIFSPGHSLDSACFVGEINGLRVAFTGDTLAGEGRLGITDASTNFLDYRHSIEKLLADEPEALLPGHGLFCVRNAHELIRFAVEVLKQKWSGVLPGGPTFYPRWWLTKYGQKILDW